MRHFKRKRRLPRRRRFLARLILAAGLCLAVVIFINVQVTPVFRAYASADGHTLAVRALNDAVGKVLDQSGSSADQLMEYDKDASGQIVAVRANTAQINALKRQVIDEALSRLSALRDSDIHVPLGTVFGGALFAGQGPPVRLRFSPTGSVDAKVSSAFTSAGINQTRQTITLTASFDIFVVLMGRQVSVHVQNDYLVADSVIVGTVPGTYFDSSSTSGSSAAGYAYSSGSTGAVK